MYNKLNRNEYISFIHNDGNGNPQESSPEIHEQIRTVSVLRRRP